MVKDDTNPKSVHIMDDFGQPLAPTAKVMPVLYLHLRPYLNVLTESVIKSVDRICRK